MNTKLSVDQIQLALIKHDAFDIRRNIVVPNVSWGLLNHEADMIIMSKSGYLTEIEIKRSIADLRADFKKSHDHSDPLVRDFYYCVPESLVNECAELCKTNRRIVKGILSYTEDGSVYFESSKILVDEQKGYYPLSNGSSRKLFIEEQLQLARLGCMRIWSLKQKLNE